MEVVILDRSILFGLFARPKDHFSVPNIFFPSRIEIPIAFGNLNCNFVSGVKNDVRLGI